MLNRLLLRVQGGITATLLFSGGNDSRNTMAFVYALIRDETEEKANELIEQAASTRKYFCYHLPISDFAAVATLRSRPYP